jgi:predicted DNA binding protein
MATVAEYTIPLQDFSFGQICTDFSDHDIEIERVKSTDDLISIYLWVSNPPTDSPDDADRSNFESLTHLDTVGDESLFRTDLSATQENVLKSIDNADVILESATLKSQEWSIRLRTESPEQIAEFQQYCQEHGFNVRLTRFPSLIQIYNSREFKLTEKQHEALRLAYSEGYFDKPREATLEELGEKLNVTPEAVLARIQNGQKNILEHTIVRSVNTPF